MTEDSKADKPEKRPLFLPEVSEDTLKALSGSDSKKLGFGELYLLGAQESAKVQTKIEAERLAFERSKEEDRLKWEREREENRLEVEGRRYDEAKEERTRGVLTDPKITGLLEAMHLRIGQLEEGKATTLEQQKANTVKTAVEDVSGIVNRLTNKIDSVADLMIPRISQGRVVAQPAQTTMTQEQREAYYKKLGINIP